MYELLQDLLIKSAKQNPDRIAVRYKSKEISYGELDKISNQLAWVLIQNGVRRGDRIGIYLDKSIDSIISIFGILKAGAVYVPLDPVSPPIRLAYIIKDCSIQYLITSSNKIPRIRQMFLEGMLMKCIVNLGEMRPDTRPPLNSVKFISRHEVLTAPSSFKIKPKIKNTDLAYILYTSGSTGRPKGIMITHKSSLAFINWAYRCFGFTREDRASNHAPLHFDLSIFDIFVTIKASATMCMVPQGTSAFPRSLAEFIEREEITVWYSVPSTLIQLVLYGDLKNKDLSSLRLVLFAGEVFPSKHLRKLITMIPHAQFYNLYGPTETNVCTYYLVESMPSDNKPVPIGRSCDNLETFAIDEENNLIKPGSIGELYVSGPTLMNGYWNTPDKTREALVKLPLYSKQNKITYRTGDLVTIDECGNYIFVGRQDNMIKSRGYRIELEEIESILYIHPEVEESAVVAVPNEETGNKIKAVIVPRRSNSLSSEKIKNFCLRRLPQYMVPEIIEFRDWLPKTSTGKVDRQKLIM